MLKWKTAVELRILKIHNPAAYDSTDTQKYWFTLVKRQINYDKEK